MPCWPAGWRGGGFFSTHLTREQDERTGRQLIPCPTADTDEIIADIATVFHWSPSECYAMTVSELLKWHERAATRNGNES
ncbi:GpE family phage tail protein [Xenorhabdus sp. PB61.4]|uniref:GpE family phage tail protein n=1 Tax=Xenorhabdus sp. PB61.4 TaxID=2788940 RepID=UPI00351D5EDD